MRPFQGIVLRMLRQPYRIAESAQHMPGPLARRNRWRMVSGIIDRYSTQAAAVGQMCRGMELLIGHPLPSLSFPEIRALT